MDIQEEKQLIILLQLGNKEAFSLLYEQYWERVYNFSRLYISDINLVEDIVQEVFIKLWISREMIHANDSIKSLLFFMARNLIFIHHRKKINEDFYKMTVLQAMAEDSYANVEEEYEAHDLQDFINKLIQELSPRCQEIFNMSRKQNLSYKEIAQSLQISEKTVENQISIALKHLKKNLYLLIMFM